MERAALAAMIDHTLLAPTATADQVALLCAEAAELGVAAVCLSPSRLPLPAGALPPSIAVCTVVGFPTGAHRTAVKAAEAAQAVADGATELDVVIDLGLAAGGRWDEVEAQIATVRDQVPDGHVLKVIIESAALRPAGVVAACEAAERAGADFVKTSTGFSKWGATVEDVKLMRKTVGPDMGVKASGGVRDRKEAEAMVAAGANRIGTSHGVEIMQG